MSSISDDYDQGYDDGFKAGAVASKALDLIEDKIRAGTITSGEIARLLRIIKEE